MDNNNSINIKNLSVSFAHHFVFDNFNLEICTGKWTTILGASGVGKTTLLRLIANLIPHYHFDKPFTGAITVGNNIHFATKIAYMAQKDLLLPWLSIIDNCLLGYKLRQERITLKLKAKAKNLLAEVGLENVINLKPQQLSTGMRQRGALVRTFLENKPIVLMDEPFAALDAITKLKLHDLAVKLLQDKTVILITHDPLEALRLSDYIYVLQGAPATTKAPIILDEPKPRDLADNKILQLQAELLKQLTNDYTSEIYE